MQVAAQTWPPPTLPGAGSSVWTLAPEVWVVNACTGRCRQRHGRMPGHTHRGQTRQESSDPTSSKKKAGELMETARLGCMCPKGFQKGTCCVRSHGLFLLLCC